MHAHHRLVATALVLGALAVPVTAQAQQDLRSPDTRDLAAQAGTSTAGQDLRSPDARDAATPAPLVTQPSPPAVRRASASREFDWGAAAIGAGAVSLLALAAAVAVAGRRRWHGGLAT